MAYVTKDVEIPLTKGLTCVVSAEDSDLAEYKWRADVAGYAVREKSYQNIIMHRVILARILDRELVAGEIVDHINGVKNDNRRNNLRLASFSDNASNSRMRSSNTSGYKGVTYFKRLGNWVAEISFKGIRYSLGYFDTPEEAHEVYKAKAKELHGEFYREDGLRRG